MKKMTTYKYADGELIWDEYGWVTDIEFFDDAEVPVELVKETWVRISDRTFWHMPVNFYSCEAHQLTFIATLGCDEDAEHWYRTADNTWLQLCQKHWDEVSPEADE